jgi:formate dehydrogenase major subunit
VDLKATVDLTKIVPGDGGSMRERIGMLPNLASIRTQELRGRIGGAKAVTSLCCYCAVGCSTLAYVSDEGKLLDVEGNPESPINGGHLCPKGAALFGLTVNQARWTTVKYRAPYSDRYEERPLEWALERIAQLMKKTRDETFVRELPSSGCGPARRVNHTLGIATLGGATFGIEENYMLGKLMHSLGVVSIENQARI